MPPFSESKRGGNDQIRRNGLKSPHPVHFPEKRNHRSDLSGLGRISKLSDDFVRKTSCVFLFLFRDLQFRPSIIMQFLNSLNNRTVHLAHAAFA